MSKYVAACQTDAVELQMGLHALCWQVIGKSRAPCIVGAYFLSRTECIWFPSWLLGYCFGSRQREYRAVLLGTLYCTVLLTSMTPFWKRPWHWHWVYHLFTAFVV